MHQQANKDCVPSKTGDTDNMLEYLAWPEKPKHNLCAAPARSLQLLATSALKLGFDLPQGDPSIMLNFTRLSASPCWVPG